MVYCISYYIVEQFSEEFSDQANNINLPSKHDLILSLAVGGKWITTQCNLQVSSMYYYLLLLLPCLFGSINIILQRKHTHIKCSIKLLLRGDFFVCYVTRAQN
jgi:hypothetical protein